MPLAASPLPKRHLFSHLAGIPWVDHVEHKGEVRGEHLLIEQCHGSKALQHTGNMAAEHSQLHVQGSPDTGSSSNPLPLMLGKDS